MDLNISHAYFDCFDHFLLTKNKVARNDDEAMSVIGTTKLGIVTNNALAVPLLSSEKGEKVWRFGFLFQFSVLAGAVTSLLTDQSHVLMLGLLLAWHTVAYWWFLFKN